MYKEDLELNNLQWLTCHKNSTQPNKQITFSSDSVELWTWLIESKFKQQSRRFTHRLFSNISYLIEDSSSFPSSSPYIFLRILNLIWKYIFIKFCRKIQINILPSLLHRICNTLLWLYILYEQEVYREGIIGVIKSYLNKTISRSKFYNIDTLSFRSYSHNARFLFNK